MINEESKRELRNPIETTREGNVITKECVEDVYKIVNRIQDAMNRSYNDSVDIIDSLQDDEYGDCSAVIFGRGVSQPCLQDAFDEEIGNSIAFMKMKLNANIKKHNFLCKIFNNYMRALEDINKEILNIDNKILFDLKGVRQHNSQYLLGIENKLGIETNNEV